MFLKFLIWYIHSVGFLFPQGKSSGTPDYIMVEKLPLQLLGCTKQMELLYIM